MQQYLFSLSTWFVILMIIFIPLERITSTNKQKVFRKEFIIDVGYYFLNNILPSIFLVLPLSIIALIVHHLEPNVLYAWVAGMPVKVRFVVAIIVGEFGAYWGHRWTHEIPWLWRFHSVHHSAQEMDWLVNTRGHPFDFSFVRFCGLVPVYVLGLAQSTGNKADLIVLIYPFIGVAWSFFVHANMGWRFGALEKVFATPAFHHWHHTNDGAEYIDKNYAAIFPWVDKIFGTYYLPRTRWPEKYGIDAPMARTIIGQLIQPLEGDLPAANQTQD